MRKRLEWREQEERVRRERLKRAIEIDRLREMREIE